LLSLCFCLSCFFHHLLLHSFPTRRSSDLISFKCHCRSILKLIIPVILQVNVFIFVSIKEFTLSRFLNMASKDIHSLSFNQRECEDRKSTRLNSSHVSISYAVFCLKKKNKP